MARQLMAPDCPICKTNKYMVEDYDAATHTGGVKDGKHCCSYSNSFKCTKCGGAIQYHEERLADEICDMEIKYRKPNYNTIRRVVG